MVQTYKTEEQKEQYDFLKKNLNERQWRLYLASEAKKLGRGGTATVSRLSGASTKRIARGLSDMEERPLPDGRIRRSGAGRKKLSATDATLSSDLESLLDPRPPHARHTAHSFVQ